MTPIPIPKEMVNDDAYLVVSLLAEPRQKVVAGQPLAELESSKSTFTVNSPADGHFLPDFGAGQMAPVNGRFGVIADSPPPESVGENARDEPSARDFRFSLPAWNLLVEKGLSPSRFAGMNHIRRADVEKILAEEPKPFDISFLATILDSEKRDSLVMLGGGGHCRECIEIVERAGQRAILGIIDSRAKPGSQIAGYTVIGANDVLPELRRQGIPNLVLAYGISGDHKARGEHFAELAELGHRFPAVIHPMAAVNRHAVVGDGAQIMAGALIGSQAVVSDACIVNSNSVVSHDCRLAENVHVAPGAILAGNVCVGRDAVIGMGATVYMRVRIGAGAVIHNGARVFNDVGDGEVVR